MFTLVRTPALWYNVAIKRNRRAAQTADGVSEPSKEDHCEQYYH